MKSFKRAFWVSFLMNIVLAYCFYRQNQHAQGAKRREAAANKELQDMKRKEEETNKAIDYSLSKLANIDKGFAELNQDIRERTYQIVAHNDQLDAFIEEHSRHDK
jgi:peptidoglycan hydrolase CwlO-like protein